LSVEIGLVLLGHSTRHRRGVDERGGLLLLKLRRLL
jgi:hypothetical protein